MKYLALGFGLLTLLVFNRPAATQQKTSDDAAVRATVMDYIEGYYTGDTARMEKTLHPHYLKHMLHGNIPMSEKTAAQIMRDVRSNGAPSLPQAERTEQISVLDVSGDIASTKLVTPHWVDYITLSKADGKWKILSVVQRFDD